MKGHVKDIAYAAPISAVAFLSAPVGGLLHPLYAKYFGVSLAAIAVVLVLGRVVDAVTDPLIGYASDRLTQRNGNPALLVFAGAVLLSVCGYFLFIPLGYDPTLGEGSVSVFYFGFWFIAYYIALTMIDIPHAAWGGALASSAKHKTRIYTYRTVSLSAGGIGFYFMPYIFGGDSTEITPETLSAATFVFFVVAPLVFYPFYRAFCRKKAAPISIEKRGQPNLSVLAVYRTLLRNKPYRVLTAAHMCTGFAASMYLAMLFFYVDAYLGLGERFALLFIITFGAGISSYPVWYAIAARWGRRSAWTISLAFVAVGFAGAATLQPGEGAWLPFLLFSGFIKVGFAPFMPFLSAYLSEVSDYGALKFKTDATSTYFAAYGFVNKVLVALAASVAFLIIGWFGFDPTASTQSESAMTGMRIVFVWIPAGLLVLAVIFVANIPINERRHGVIRRRLDQRADRLSRSTAPK